MTKEVLPDKDFGECFPSDPIGAPTKEYPRTLALVSTFTTLYRFLAPASTFSCGVGMRTSNISTF